MLVTLYALASAEVSSHAIRQGCRCMCLLSHGQDRAAAGASATCRSCGVDEHKAEETAIALATAGLLSAMNEQGYAGSHVVRPGGLCRQPHQDPHDVVASSLQCRCCIKQRMQVDGISDGSNASA